MLEELKTIVDSLNNAEMLFFDGATEEQILTFEKENDFVLSEKYKEWLKFSDGGYLYLPAGVQLYGVGHEPLIDVDYADRPNEGYVVIGALATGDPILCKKGSEQISIYNHEASRIEEDEVYSDFFAFLIDLEEILGIGE